ncbi:methyl-accepting chemotaxis protein [Teredinibacter sp. KSP-S5-2]|uniref:methyl-accepting chemotaxis protein n=1 Tax=Teredinibacter sp. KSP-S5-2 TaxID=3034506 RepID=UPI0029341C9C|nr:methyl-accepting chemotaxis protein [Teredinibacter sp. KSP-S5-2]WNO07534.1 methyl-accepting chemotaxis protein [Teredinibacter sp. KSP-S5-2]
MMNLFRKVSINMRLWLVLVLVMFGFILITVISLAQIKSEIMMEKESQVKKLVETAYSAVLDWNERYQAGEISREQAMQGAKTAIKNLRYDGNNYFFIIDMVPKMVMHPFKPELDGSDLSRFADPHGVLLFSDMVSVARKSGQGMVPYSWPKGGNEKPVPKVSFVKSFDEWGWIIGSGIYIDDVDAIFWKNVMTLASTNLILLLAFVSGLFMMTKSVLSPLNDTTEALTDIAEGEGDLTVRLSELGSDEITKLSQAFNVFTSKIQKIISEVGDVAKTLSNESDLLASAAARNSDHIQEQEMQTHQVATAMNEMAATVNEIAQGAEKAAQAAKETDHETAAGQEVVNETVKAINTLAEEVSHAANVIDTLNSNTEKIGSVLDVIRGIAEQTNLLALNAAIEAARAGEQGRGFAVVADEVRTLAARTQESTQEINQMIEDLQQGAAEAVKVMQTGRDSAQQTVELASKARVSLENIASSVATISDMNMQIASAAEEQTATAREIDMNVVQISQLSQQSAQDTEKTAKSAHDLVAVSDSLNNMVKQFKY